MAKAASLLRSDESVRLGLKENWQQFALLILINAFVGGMVIPAIALLGLALIPYLDRGREEAGVYLDGPGAKRTAGQSLLFGALTAAAAVAVPVRFGWLRTWFPSIPQLVIILLNPGTILTALYAGWSLSVLKRTGSTRLSAIALFTCFVIGFVILTYVGSELRGPNWGFYWSKSQWPVH